MWRKYHEPHQWTAFKKVRNQYVYEINKAKKETMTDLVLNCKGDSKKLYTLVSKLTGSVKDNPLPSAENDENLANEFADYFMDKNFKN